MPGMTDRDHFAAAALTGLLAQGDDGSFSEESYVRGAYRWADAMLRERAKTNHDAAPAATAQDLGTGDTTKPIKGGVSDRSKPINGPDPDSRVWETPVHTPAPHATPGEGSERRECTEPVAWAVRYRHGDTGIVDLCRTLADCRAKWSNRTTDYWLYEPLYRHPPCQDVSQKNLTLTDAEREAISVAYGMMNERAAKLQGRIATLEAARPLIQWARALHGLFERLGGGR